MKVSRLRLPRWNPPLMNSLTNPCPQYISAPNYPRNKSAVAPASEQSMNQDQPEDVFGQGTPFAISVDGESVVSGTITDAVAKADAGLSAADIQVKYDGLEVTPFLNASHRREGRLVRFHGHLNYPDFVEKGEFRVYRMKDGKVSDLITVASADEHFRAEWAGAAGDGQVSYVLRVYDSKRPV